MAKKRKSSLTWTIVKGISKGVWYTAKGVGKGIGAIYGFSRRKIKESSEKRKLESKPTYKMQPVFEPLKVMKSVAGDYSASEKKLHKDSIIAMIFGKRGSGKSALGFRLLENIHHKTKRKCFVLGVEQEFMPQWINPVERIDDVPKGSIVLVDEGALSFNSRESMSGNNRALGGLLAVARHKNLTILFVTQNTGMIDKNVLKLSDMLLVKQGSLLQLEMERPEIRKFYEKAEESFANLKGEKRQYVYMIDSDFEGAISHSLPSFWTENLSKNKSDE